MLDLRARFKELHWVRLCVVTAAKGEENGEIIHASQVIITTGTFLGGEIHIGESRLVPL